MSVISQQGQPQAVDIDDLPIGGFELYDANAVRGTDPDLDRFLRYFEDKTGGTRLPRRADFSPQDMKGFLPDLCIMRPLYDSDGALDDVFVQLMGTNLVHYYGEVTGQNLKQTTQYDATERILIAIRHAIAMRTPVVAAAHALSRKKNHLRVTVAYIPMAEDGVQIDRFLLLNRVRLRSASL